MSFLTKDWKIHIFERLTSISITILLFFVNLQNNLEHFSNLMKFKSIKLLIVPNVTSLKSIPMIMLLNAFVSCHVYLLITKIATDIFKPSICHLSKLKMILGKGFHEINSYHIKIYLMVFISKLFLLMNMEVKLKVWIVILHKNIYSIMPSGIFCI
jgi:hypothetical protein